MSDSDSEEIPSAQETRDKMIRKIRAAIITQINEAVDNKENRTFFDCTSIDSAIYVPLTFELERRGYKVTYSGDHDIMICW